MMYLQRLIMLLKSIPIMEHGVFLENKLTLVKSDDDRVVFIKKQQTSLYMQTSSIMGVFIYKSLKFYMDKSNLLEGDIKIKA